MRGVAYDPILRAKLMALHQQGVPLVQLSAEYRHRPPGPRPLVAALSGRRLARALAAVACASAFADASASGHCPAHPAGASAPDQRGPHRLGPRVGARDRAAGAGTSWPESAAAPGAPKPQRYEKQRPGELLHLDIKFLPALRNARYDYEFAAVDDFSREAVVWITTEATSAAATDFLERVLTTLPYPVEAILTDNAVAASMPDLSGEMNELSKQMNVLSRKMTEASAKADVEMQALVDKLIKLGTAKPID